ncbi:MAG TPA: FG-GAP-like repeat-containing protein [Pyrinomonadaceae bacterium]|nr:FG-GAP-like repeat-containing protein [Pyrinomonadaceae bacterium]
MSALKPLIILLVILMSAEANFGSDCYLPLFGAPGHFQNGGHTVRIAIADFNNDGHPDIAATAHDNQRVGVFLGNSAGFFAQSVWMPAGRFSVPVVAGDFNRDGNQDLAVGSSDGTVWIYLGDGTGHFSIPTQYPDGPGEAYEIVAADFDTDGQLDLAIGHQFGGLSIMKGDGSGGFSHIATYLADMGPVRVASADFNNDGKIDLITSNAHTASASILLGNGLGAFSVSSFGIPYSNANNGFAIADFNLDGKLDLVATNNDTSVTIFFGDGAGNFIRGADINSGAAFGPVAGDFNVDGKMDVAVTNGNIDRLSIIFGDGNGGFSAPSNFPTGRGPGYPYVYDLTGDHLPDIVMPDYYGQDLTVSINNGHLTRDVDPPLVYYTPNIQTYATTPAGASVPFQIGAMDNSGLPPSLECDKASNSLFPLGSTSVTCVAIDSCDNRSPNFSFMVSVICSPLNLSPLGDLQVAATEPSGAVVNYNSIDGVASVNFSIPSGSHFPIGTSHVTYTVTELCGNTVNGSFNVTVVDEPPVLTVPGDIPDSSSTSAGRVVTYVASATDTVSGNLPVNCNHPSGTTFPIGQTVVTCTATDSAGNATTRSFTVFMSLCLGCTVPTFAPAAFYSAGGSTGYIVNGDFNEDGYPDLVTSGPRSPWDSGGPVNILINAGNGSFGPPIGLGIDNGKGIAVADFNRDGHLDLVVADNSSYALVIFYGNGHGEFSAPLYNYALGGFGTAMLATGDFNADGKPDILAGLGMYGNWPAAVLLGDGVGLSDTPVSFGDGNWTDGVSAVAADFNGDGKLDFFVDENNQPVLGFGDGHGGFSTQSFSTGSYFISAADFNGDGKADLVTDRGTLYFSDGTTFNEGQTYPLNATVVQATNVNGDGKIDIVSDKGVMPGNGAGNFGFMQDFPAFSDSVNDLTIADFNHDGKPDVAVIKNDGTVAIRLNTSFQTAVGADSIVVVNNTSFTFDNVTSGGATSVTPIDPASVGQVPGGFSVSDSVAYEIATTATFTGSVTLAFKVPGPISQADFNSLAILHNVNGNLVDVTAATPPRDYASLTIYATTNSFSPFYLARKGAHIKSLFDQAKAFKSGSTIPIKLQVLNANNANQSSANTALVTRDLRLMSANTMAPIQDSGNANPDYTFRYDPTLGGAGGGYIFNLSTKGLAAGQYVLSFYVGSDHSFFYTVKFEVK